ncbi:MAG: hypothetical protein AB7S36_12465, partial [Planctomycetota bacterium]
DGVSCEWLAACLNSAFVRWWFEVRFLSDDRYFPYLRKSQLVQVPIPDPRERDVARILQLDAAARDDAIRDAYGVATDRPPESGSTSAP